MRRILLCLHWASVVAGYLLVVVAMLLFSPAVTGWRREGVAFTMVVWAVPLLAIAGFLTGLILMAWRKDKRESIALAISTVAALLLSLCFPPCVIQ
jgi:hypothetical protein